MAAAPDPKDWRTWLIGILTALLVPAGLGAIGAIHTHGEKIAVLESQVERLGRIEDKLDEVLKRGHK